MQREMPTSVRVCALRYCQPAQVIEPVPGALILLAAKEGPTLRLYAQASLLRQISESDRDYITGLLEDLVDRSKLEPNEVFRQLSTLSSGPIVTDRVYQLDSGREPIEELYPGFEAWS